MSDSSNQSGKFRMNDGDWVCPDSQCANVNFARRSTCNRCGQEKLAVPPRKKLGHEIGKCAAEKSRGLFSPDDWQCGRCGNVNWARRMQCNMCNAPKFGEVEERTGLGGGYNERENIEYVEREESDGEYDDYGRKKKKFRGKEDEKEDNKNTTSKHKLGSEEEKKSNNNADEEEEEEEEDDDGDLSKYDLSGWGDDDEKDSSKADKKDRSESRSSRDSSSSSSSSRSSSRSSRRSSSRSRSSSRDSRSRKRRRSSSRSKSRSRSRSSSRDRSSRKRR